MAKMKSRNLKEAIGSLGTNTRIIEAQNLPTPDTTNLCGSPSYAVEDAMRLVSMLNTLKLEPQFYRSENETLTELGSLIRKVADRDPYFVCQAIAWSRSCGEGMRSINHVAAALVAPFVSGTSWGKRFYSSFNTRTQSGGCIRRVDDMSEIKDAYSALATGTLTNSMKKGFASVIESFDGYQLAKYKKSVRDICNLVHPNSAKSTAVITIDNRETKVIDAIMKGLKISANTWEAYQTEAGQVVAEAVKEGKLSETEAAKVLEEAKAENWEELLANNELGYLAALRNIRNIVEVCKSRETIDKLCNLLSNGEIIRKALILPYQIGTALDILKMLNTPFKEQIQAALISGYEQAVPNLAEVLKGNTLVVLDTSDSMDAYVSGTRTRCIDKGALVAATVSKATDGDVLLFGSRTQWVTKCGKTENVFDFAKRCKIGLGGTYLDVVFEELIRTKKAYDRIIIISDMECNGRVVSDVYKRYIKEVCSPYIYEVDMASYGTIPIKNDGKVSYYYGGGFAMFDDIKRNEFDPQHALDKIRQYVI